MVAKISADKGVSFDFMNNEKIKASGFAVEGRTVNGLVTKDGNIAINVNSTKALNSVVGHEITHILKGTELFSEVQTMLKGIAESKGEYQSRYDEISKLYEGVEGANIEEELTADLVGDYLFTDRDFISRLSAEKPGVFKKFFDEIKYLCRVATAGSKEAKELEKVKKTFEELYRESKAEKNTAEGGVRYSLNIQHSNGTVEELADARDLTEKQALIYLKQAKSGELRRNSYIPVRKDTPQVIIDTLKQVGENVDNLSLVMSVNKARQAMSNRDKSGNSKNKGDNVRGHSLKPEEILEIIKGLDEPSLMIYQTERYDKNGKELPNNVAVFVEFNNGEKEGMAVVEFDSEFDNYTIGNEFGETQYHTVVTVFEPDTIRNGEEYDYAQELLENPNNIELEIRRRQPNESATGEKHPNTFKELPSSTDSISDSAENVKQKGDFSLSSKDTAPKKYGDYAVYGEDVMLEGEAKPTGKREFTAPMRADVNKNFPMLDEDDALPIRKELKNDLLSRSAKSFGITKPGDYVQVQRQVFDTLEKEGFFSDEGSRSRTVTNSDSSMQVEINKKGIKETFNFDNYGKQGIRKKAMKLATVRMLPQIIENGKLIGDNVENYHNDESSNKFAYIKSEVQIDGQDVVVKIDIKKSPQKNKFWVHSIDIKEKVDGLPADTSRVLKRANEHIDYEDSISNTDENVNSKKDDGAEQILGESQLRTAEPKKNNIRDAWKGFLRSFVSKGAEVETYALKGKNRAVEDKYKMWKDRSEAKAQYFMEKGDGIGKSLKDIYDTVTQSGLEKEFDLYMKHRLNVDRMKYKNYPLINSPSRFIIVKRKRV